MRPLRQPLSLLCEAKQADEGYSGVYAIITIDFRHWREGFAEIGSRLNTSVFSGNTELEDTFSRFEVG